MAIAFKDIMALALKGYKPSDIRELVNIANELNEKEAESTNDNPDPVTEGVENTPSVTTPTEDSEVEDYKKLYEQAKHDLKEAQKANINKDISDKDKPTVSDEDLIKSWISENIKK